MYVPTPFDGREAGNDVLELLLQRDPFITLMSVHQGQALASHLPVLGTRMADGRWCLEGHWARANPQAEIADGETATAIVLGPHAYISPRWTPEPVRAVPTWNYVAVHASGRIRRVDEAEPLLDLVDRLAARFEAGAEAPWRLRDGHPSLLAMARGIVGFRLEVERLEVALKLSQNHAPPKLRGLIQGLDREARTGERELAQWMQDFVSTQPPGP